MTKVMTSGGRTPLRRFRKGKAIGLKARSGVATRSGKKLSKEGQLEGAPSKDQPTSKKKRCIAIKA